MGANDNKRLNLPLLANLPKRTKREEPPFKRGPSTWTRTDSIIMNPFLRVRPMSERGKHLNKYVGGKVDHRLLQNVLFEYLLPLLELVKESLGDKAGELNNRLSFVALPVLIRVLSKKEKGPQPMPLPKPQTEAIEAALEMLQKLSDQLQGSSEAVTVCCQKVTDLAGDLERLLTISLEKEQELKCDDNDEEPEFNRYRTQKDREEEEELLQEERQAAGSSGTEDAVTPKDQMLPTIDPSSVPSWDSPDSAYDPEFTHEMTMGAWSIDLGMKVRDKRFPLQQKMVKNLMDGKGAATIVVSDESPGGINQLQAYSCYHLMVNAGQGRFSSIFSQLFNVDQYLGAEAVLTTIVTLDEDGKVTPAALKKAQDLQKEVWEQQRPGEPFDDKMLVSLEQLTASVKEGERLLHTMYGVPKEEAKLPSKRYVVADFYRNESLHEFLTVPLGHVPGPSTWAFLEAQLLIGIGDRVTEWTWEDVKSRLRADLERRGVRQEKMLRRMDKEGWIEDWKKHGQANSLEELVWAKEDLL